jgi:hypothetical protein
MSKAILALSLGGLVLAATPARAGWYVQGIPGASCATNPGLTTAPWEYRGRRLLNTSSDPWAIVVAACPVSLFAPGVEPREYRLILNDPQARDSWCKAYTYSGALLRTHWGSGGGTYSLNGALDSGVGWPGGLVEVTFHCLLQSGASIERIEIVWWKP